MKRILIAFVLLLALTGVVLATETQTGQSGTAYVNSNLAGASYTVTIPVSIDIGTLNRLTNNEGIINGISVQSDVPWKLTISSTYTQMHTLDTEAKHLTNPFMIWTPGLSTFVQPSTNPQITGSASGTPSPVVITYRQLIDPADTPGNYQIPLTFTVQPQ